MLSLIYFWINFGLRLTASMVVQPLLYYVAYLTKQKLLVWGVSLATLLSLKTSNPFHDFMNGLISEGHPEKYLAHVTWAWINAR